MEQTQIEQPKRYPHEEEDIQFEQEIIEAIKKLPLEKRLQLIALNTFLLAKKQDDEDAGTKIDEINNRYTKLQEPHVVSINQIIAGERAPTQEEIAEYKDQLTAEEVEKIGENLTAEVIPDYWFKVLTTCVRFENDIFESDHALLKKITKIDCVPEEGSSDFSIVFNFAPNDYFENTSISAKFFLVEDDVAEKIEASEIQWKEGKNITQKSITKRKKNKKTGKHQNITKLVDADSFFNIFKTVEVPDSAEGEEGEEGQEMLQKIQERLDIAHSIREEILLHHLEYYLGLRKGDEDGGLMGSGGPFAEYDDEDEEEIPKIGGKKKGGK